MGFFEKLGLYESRLAYAQRMEKRSGKEKAAQATAYLLSDACAEDIARLQQGEYVLGLPTQFFRKTPTKTREIHAFSGRDKYLLGLIRYGLHDYDGCLSPNLYSSVLGRNKYQAFRAIATTPGIHGMYCFKTDVSSYSHSIDGDIMKSILKKHFEGDKPLYAFLCHYLDERRYYRDGEIAVCDAPVMQGSAMNSFFENFYLSELDLLMGEAADVYARYVDDMIVYASSREKLMACRQLVTEELERLKLPEKKEKVVFADPGEYITFLGFELAGSKRKIAEVWHYLALIKVLTHRIMEVRRKFNFSPEMSILLMVRKVDASFDHLYKQLPYLTETEELRTIDHAVQDALRRVGSGRNDKKRYNIRYEMLRGLGYKSLVCRFYEARQKGGTDRSGLEI